MNSKTPNKFSGYYGQLFIFPHHMDNPSVFVHYSPLRERLVTVWTDWGEPTHRLVVGLLRVRVPALPALRHPLLQHYRVLLVLVPDVQGHVEHHLPALVVN